MAKTHTDIMKALYGQLQDIGIPKAFARMTLPDWWDDEIVLSESGYQQAKLYFSSVFNIEWSSFDSQSTPLYFATNQQHKFKLNKNVDQNAVSPSAQYATAIAKLALKAFKVPFVPVAPDPLAIRNIILEKHENVGLESLLEYCNNSGLPVLHVPKLPGKKMMGIAIRLNGRFAIVLSKNCDPSSLLFHLAHELGHIAKNHLQNDGFVADETIGHGTDSDEQEADDFAIQLLNGKKADYTSKVPLNAKSLFTAALLTAKEKRVDLGHVILNYSNTNNMFAVGQTALKFIKHTKSGPQTINSNFYNNSDMTFISEDQESLLHKTVLI
ncbi:ImmA/IrrE family metallo-endopeptidase [Methylobacillus pratensis]